MKLAPPFATAPLLLVLVSSACTPQGDPAIGPGPFTEDFERDQLGELWHNTGGPYRLQDGMLRVRGARNKPLWLRRVLPRDVRIEVDVRSDTPDGDLKLEVFGDGASKAESESYTATSYVIIFGGWDNSTNAIARMDEHADDRVIGTRLRVESGRTYRMKIERQGSTITYYIDDQKIAELNDADPLEGRGHDHFAFNNWMSDSYFDNLVITPL